MTKATPLASGIGDSLRATSARHQADKLLYLARYLNLVVLNLGVAGTLGSFH